jgi:hypothetical protein
LRCSFLGKQKVVLFPKYRENGWEAAASALITALKSSYAVSGYKAIVTAPFVQA